MTQSRICSPFAEFFDLSSAQRGANVGAQLLQLVSSSPKSLREKMREAAYAAIDKLVDELPEEIDGKDLEAISDATGEAMRSVARLFSKRAC